jgi:hypothetical protein
MLFIVIRGLAEAEPFDLLLPLWMITLISVTVEQTSTAKSEDHAAAIIAAELQLRERDLSVRKKPAL